MSSGRLTLRARLAASIHPISGRPASPDRGEDRVLRAQRCEMSAADGRVSRSTRTCFPSLPPDRPCPEPRRRDNVDRFPSRHPCDGRRPRRCREAPPGLPRRPPGPVEPASGRRVRHVRTPRLVAVDHLQRRPHRRHLPGDRRVPQQGGTDGPLFVGADTHALSGPALQTCVEVLAANDVAVLVDAAGGYTPTPAVSHAILAHNRSRAAGIADGIVITPSHNPPAGRRLQVQPAQWRARRHGRHEVDRRTGRTSCSRRSWTGCSDGRSTGRRAGHVRLPRPLRRRPARGGEPRRDPQCRSCGSARTRWAGPASRTGGRSPSATAST